MLKRHPKPCGYRVLVKLKKSVEDIEEVSDSGLVLKVRKKAQVDLENSCTQEAYAVKIGPTAFKDYGGPSWCKEGDCILITKHAGDLLPSIEDGELYRIINDQDVLMVYEGEGLND